MHDSPLPFLGSLLTFRKVVVRAHHEKWDGSGYPAGLKGEEIPIGARILSAVDCLDALATDRQYRRALPLDKAMEIVAAESGRQFDPVIVEILKRRYVELEQMARSSSGTEELAKLSVDVKVERGQAPAAGLARNAQTAQTHESFLAAIAAAREEAQTLYEMSSMLGSSLSLDETLSMFSSRLKKQIAYDSIAIYLASENSRQRRRLPPVLFVRNPCGPGTLRLGFSE